MFMPNYVYVYVMPWYIWSALFLTLLLAGNFNLLYVIVGLKAYYVLSSLIFGLLYEKSNTFHFLPSTQVEPNEEPHAAADRLAASLYLSDHLVVPVSNTALADGTVIRTYVINLGTREYDMIPTAQQVSELLDSQTIRWLSQDQVNSDSVFGYHEVGPLTDALNEAPSKATRQNLIAGVGQLSIAHPASSPLFREVQALSTQTLLSVCANTPGDESDGRLSDLLSASSDSDSRLNEPTAETPTNTTQAAPCQYNSTDSPMTSPTYSPVDTSETDNDLPYSA